MSKINIKDVASLAGVSTATVSHVLNGTRKVNECTANKVLEAASVLKYKPDMIARGFRTGKTNTIGIIVPDISNRFFSFLIETIEELLYSYGYHLIVVNTREIEQRELDHINYLVSGVADGIIIASTLSDSKSLKTVLPNGFPAVFVDRKPKNLCWDNVSISSDRAIRDSIAYLFNRGHRRIGFICGTPHISTNIERLSAFQAAMRQHGMEDVDSYVRYGLSMEESTRRSIVELLDINCTALVVCNGLMTYEAQRFLEERPELAGKDVEILGFKDEYRMISQNQYIAQPVEEMAKNAVELIINRINNGNVPIQEIVLNSFFVA